MKSIVHCLAAATLAFLTPAGFLAAQDVGGAEKVETKPRAQHKSKNTDTSAVSVIAVEDAAPTVVVEQDYEPSPAIWKLADEDTTIYLFGTFHVLPEGFKWRSAQFDAVVGEVDELVVETSDEDSDAAEVMAMQIFSGIADRTPTSQRLSPEAGEKWKRLAQLSGMPLAMFDRTPPLVAIMGLGVSFAESLGSEADYGVETVLEAEFKEAGKPIGSIEDGARIFAELLAIPEELLFAELETELAKWDGEKLEDFLEGYGDDAEEAAETLPFDTEHRWAKGESVGDMDFGDSPFAKAFAKILLEDRNRAWAEWLETRLETPGKVLLAVGAGHFEGNVSVQVMLAERGIALERLN